MGGIVSTGQNNDDLIDNLREADYIKSAENERVFRAVDRAEYFLPEFRNVAYKDLAWKHGNYHISAPCIYSEVMEALCLEPGLSFLNLGSGTGYLSTIIGLILGSHGVNHGVEFYEDVVQYAVKKLEDFKKFSGAIDEYDFCEPKFTQGNCLCLRSDCVLYDRVYCGAACPDQYEFYMKNLIKVGGILVIPQNDQLLQIKRVSETSWETQSLMPVSFASLIKPSENTQDSVCLSDFEPLSLQQLCRTLIRNLLRKNIEKENPSIKKPINVSKTPKKKRTLKRLTIPLFESDSSDDDLHVNYGRNREGRAGFRSDSDGILNFILGSLREPGHLFNDRNRNESGGDKTEAMETEEDRTQIVEAVIEHVPEEEEQEREETVHVVQLNQREEPGNSVNTVRNKTQREKFDSGLGDEIIETHSDSSDYDCVKIKKKMEWNSSSDEEEGGEEEIQEAETPRKRLNSSKDYEGEKMRKVSHRMVACSSSEDERDPEIVENEMRMYRSPYTPLMRSKIQELPLPTCLKAFLNFYREF